MLFSTVWRRRMRFPAVRPESINTYRTNLSLYICIPCLFLFLCLPRPTVKEPLNVHPSPPLNSRYLPTTHTEVVQTYIILVNRIWPSFYWVYPFLVTFVFHAQDFKCSLRSNPSIPFRWPMFGFASFLRGKGATDEFQLLLIHAVNHYTSVDETTFQHWIGSFLH